MITLLVKNIFVLLHISMAAAWFGMGLRLAAQARTAVASAEEGGAILANDTMRTTRFMGHFLGLTLVFGLVAFFLGGGFSFYTPNFHTSILLVVLMVVVQEALIKPAWRRLHAALVASPIDSEAAEQARKRIGMATGIGHLLWFVVLVLMLWNRYPLSL